LEDKDHVHPGKEELPLGNHKLKSLSNWKKQVVKANNLMELNKHIYKNPM
jgi:hypothetical protein